MHGVQRPSRAEVGTYEYSILIHITFHATPHTPPPHCRLNHMKYTALHTSARGVVSYSLGHGSPREGLTHTTHRRSPCLRARHLAATFSNKKREPLAKYGVAHRTAVSASASKKVSVQAVSASASKMVSAPAVEVSASKRVSAPAMASQRVSAPVGAWVPR